MSDGQAYADSQRDDDLSADPVTLEEDGSSARYDDPGEGAGSPGPERPFMVRASNRYEGRHVDAIDSKASASGPSSPSPAP